ncbi:hypothetical protein EIP91_001783 [Steccherinum ochraceum]|uniref:Fungal-type protein kinase domain-containing protein n=1 Tax=Steccherinum ochraceum TaxID=92696 RepID=A0A4R0S2R3_9APHY|nr:hypothetical protein EIP91_001783 [Steccherinum ochraceum]
MLSYTDYPFFCSSSPSSSSLSNASLDSNSQLSSDIEMVSGFHPVRDAIPEDRVADFGSASLDEDGVSRAQARHSTPPPSKQPAASASKLPVPQSTPSRPSIDSSERWDRTEKPRDDAIKKWLHDVLLDKVICDYPVVDFIFTVFGFKKEDFTEKLLARPPDDPYRLSESHCNDYITGEYTKKSHRSVERSAYPPLENLLRHLYDQLQSASPFNGAEIVALNDHLVRGSFAQVFPDFLTSWLHGDQGQLWKLAANAGELKKKLVEERPYAAVIDIEKLPDRNAPYNPPPQAAPIPGSSSVASEAASLEPDAQTISTAQSSQASSSSSRRGLKRKASKIPDGLSSKSKRRKSKSAVTSLLSDFGTVTSGTSFLIDAKSKIRGNELQIMKYLHELGSAGIRSFSTGFLIEDYTMTLWYMDRMGVVKSVSFDFLKEPHFLLLYIAAVKFATPQQLGFFPLLKFPNDRIDKDVLESYKGVSLDLSGSEDMMPTTLNDLRFVFDISDTRPLISPFSSMGRATIVAPINADPSSKTAIELCGTSKVVTKISWQSKWREAEDHFVRVARKALDAKDSTKEILKHIVDIKCSLTLSMEQLHLPRAAMEGIPKTDDYERVCRVLVMTEYFPLRLVTSPEEFKTIYVGALRGHRAVYKIARILHRDISINNIMFYIDATGRVIGVLCDWDMAKELGEITIEDMVRDTILSQAPPCASSTTPSARTAPQQTEQSLQKPTTAGAGSQPATRERKYRTGTFPFMALDLLRFVTPPHNLYRHDLESFFYVLVWFVGKFRPKEKRIGVVRKWLGANFEQVGVFKSNSIRSMDPIDEIVDGGDDAYRSACSPWIRALLMQLIKPVTTKYETIRDEVKDLWYERKPELAKLSLDENIAAAWKLYPKIAEREDIITYKSFMRCLGEEVGDDE